MSISKNISIVAFCVVSWFIGVGASPAEDGKGAAAVEAALAKPVTFDFNKEPIKKAVDFFKKQCTVDIVFDSNSMADVGIEDSEPVTVKASGIKLQAALNLIMRQIDLRWTVEDEVILVTTPEEAESIMSIKAYDVSDLVVYRDEDDEEWDYYGALIETLCHTTMPTTWDCVGGPGTIVGASLGTARVLVVKQTHQAHCKIADVLAQIREVAKKHPDGELPRRERHEKSKPDTSAVKQGK